MTSKTAPKKADMVRPWINLSEKEYQKVKVKALQNQMPTYDYLAIIISQAVN